ncbi:MAG: M23 family metallopeptidase [Patescibacteria group bacterium]
MKARLVTILVIFLLILTNSGQALSWRYPVGTETGEGWINKNGLQWLQGYNYDYQNTKVNVPHPGIDFNMDNTSGDGDAGQNVYAVNKGKVVFSGYATGWGNLIIIQHDLQNDGFVQSVYGHLQDVFVEAGKDFDEHLPIGTVGNTGTTNAHLHFEIRSSRLLEQPEYTSPKYFPYFQDKSWVANNYYNPETFLNFNMNSNIGSVRDDYWSQTLSVNADGMNLTLDETIGLSQNGSEITGNILSKIELQGCCGPISAVGNITGAVKNGNLLDLNITWISNEHDYGKGYEIVVGGDPGTVENRQFRLSNDRFSLSPANTTPALWWNDKWLTEFGTYTK